MNIDKLIAKYEKEKQRLKSEMKSENCTEYDPLWSVCAGKKCAFEIVIQDLKNLKEEIGNEMSRRET